MGATGNTDVRTSWSNYGACVDIFAPGSSILSLTQYPNAQGGPAVRTLSGTSMVRKGRQSVVVVCVEKDPKGTQKGPKRRSEQLLTCLYDCYVSANSCI